MDFRPPLVQPWRKPQVCNDVTLYQKGQEILKQGLAETLNFLQLFTLVYIIKKYYK